MTTTAAARPAQSPYAMPSRRRTTIPSAPGIYTAAGYSLPRLSHYLVLGVTHRLRWHRGGPVVLSDRDQTDARTIRI